MNMYENIIALPCKVGDTIWRIDDVWYVDSIKPYAGRYEKEVVEYYIRSISISCNSKGVWTKKIRGRQIKDGKAIDYTRDFSFDDFGTRVFYTREDAEQKLEELKHEES